MPTHWPVWIAKGFMITRCQNFTAYACGNKVLSSFQVWNLALLQSAATCLVILEFAVDLIKVPYMLHTRHYVRMCRGVLMWSIGRPRFKINRKGFTRTFFFLKALSPSFLSQSLEYARFGGLRGTKREVQDYHVPMCKFDLIFSPAFAVYYLLYILYAPYECRTLLLMHAHSYSHYHHVIMCVCLQYTCSFQRMFVCVLVAYIHTYVCLLANNGVCLCVDDGLGNDLSFLMLWTETFRQLLVQFNARVFKYYMRIAGAIVEFMSAFVATHVYIIGSTVLSTLQIKHTAIFRTLYECVLLVCVILT